MTQYQTKMSAPSRLVFLFSYVLCCLLKHIGDITYVFWFMHQVCIICKVSNGAKIRNRYNQVPHLTQDTNGKVTNAQLDTTNESQEVSPFPAVGHKAHINRRAQRHSKHKKKNIKDPQKNYPLGTVSKIFYSSA